MRPQLQRPSGLAAAQSSPLHPHPPPRSPLHSPLHLPPPPLPAPHALHPPPPDSPLSPPPPQRVCSLWVHDESFSRQDVLFNPAALDLPVPPAGLLEITRPDDNHVPHNNDDEDHGDPDSSGDGDRGAGAADAAAAAAAAAAAPSRSGLLFIPRPLPPDVRARQPHLAISIAAPVAAAFGFRNRALVRVAVVPNPAARAASHVELAFRDQFLPRSDLWRLASAELAGRPLYRGQKVVLAGTVRAVVRALYLHRRPIPVASAVFGPRSLPVFRSQSARFVLFIQMAREMWAFDPERAGDVLFSRAVNSLLPELFARWAAADARHLVSIVLFTTAVYPNAPPQDFYRVVINDMPSGSWTIILDRLKHEFRFFYRDIAIIPGSRPVIAGHPTSARRGNILDAVNIASADLEFEHVGRDLTRTETSIVLISPGPGIFDVDYHALARTSDVLTRRAVGIDLICLSPRPLHAVPLFRYRLPDAPPPEDGGTGLDHDDPFIIYSMPHWIDVSYWDPRVYQESGIAVSRIIKSAAPGTVTRQSRLFVPKVRMYEVQMMGIMESEQSSISVAYLPPHDSPKSMDDYDAQLFHSPLLPARRNKPLTPSMTNNTLAAPPSSSSSASSIKLAHASKDNNKNNSLFPSYSSFQQPGRRSQPPSLSRSSTRSPRISRSISFALRGLAPAPPRALASIGQVQVSAQTQAAAGGNLHTTVSQSEAAASSDPAAIGAATAQPSPPSSPLVPPSASARPISIRSHFAGSGTGGPPRSVSEMHVGSPIIGSYSSLSTNLSDRPPPPLAGNPSPLARRRRAHDSRAASSSVVRSTTSPAAAPATVAASTTPSRNSQQQQQQHPPTVRALMPWVIPVDPCNPPKGRRRHRSGAPVSWFGRWQHVFTPATHASSVKWESLNSPAILPLTTEAFPTPDELASDYSRRNYRVSADDDDGSAMSDRPRTREALLKEMISLRLSRGFQFVVGHAAEVAAGRSHHHHHHHHRLQSSVQHNIFDPASLAADGVILFMSMGSSTIHKLICLESGEVEVTEYTHNILIHPVPGSGPATTTPAVKTVLDTEYCKRKVNLQLQPFSYNWNTADGFLAGHADHLTNPADQLRFWRARFVLIPVPITRRPLPSSSEDNEEETHLLGIDNLTRLWQRHRYVPPEEQRLATPSTTTPAARKNKPVPNPLNIIYMTSTPSCVIAAELDRLLLAYPGLNSDKSSTAQQPQQLLPESELFHRSSVSMPALAQAMQGRRGVRIMDRKWHWRYHSDCFIGAEFTTWLLDNFADVDSRQEAEEFGNELMNNGLFHHVGRRHHFRDGNYFYRIADEYRLARPESRTGGSSSNSWFPSRREKAPSDGNNGGNGNANKSSSTSTTTPTPANPRRISVYLSKCIRYDLDPRRRSGRPELVELHHDRLHNPGDCFHLQLAWFTATPKLLEDALVSWAATAERYGLRLVELPVSEGAVIQDRQVFRRPYALRLSVQPPPPPPSSSLCAGERPGSATVAPDPFFFHRAILDRFDFVLDYESKYKFTADVDVQYSWGRPDFEYDQYVHRSGCTLVQITHDGTFLFIANHLFRARGSVTGTVSGATAGGGGPGVSIKETPPSSLATATTTLPRLRTGLDRPDLQDVLPQKQEQQNQSQQDPASATVLSPPAGAAADGPSPVSTGSCMPGSDTGANGCNRTSNSTPTPSAPASGSTESLGSVSPFLRSREIIVEFEAFVSNPDRLRVFYGEAMATVARAKTASTDSGSSTSVGSSGQFSSGSGGPPAGPDADTTRQKPSSQASTTGALTSPSANSTTDAITRAVADATSEANADTDTETDTDTECATAMDSSIPTLELPASVIPTSNIMSRITGSGGGGSGGGNVMPALRSASASIAAAGASPRFGPASTFGFTSASVSGFGSGLGSRSGSRSGSGPASRTGSGRVSLSGSGSASRSGSATASASASPSLVSSRDHGHGHGHGHGHENNDRDHDADHERNADPQTPRPLSAGSSLSSVSSTATMTNRAFGGTSLVGGGTGCNSSAVNASNRSGGSSGWGNRGGSASVSVGSVAAASVGGSRSGGGVRSVPTTPAFGGRRVVSSEEGESGKQG